MLHKYKPEPVKKNPLNKPKRLKSKIFFFKRAFDILTYFDKQNNKKQKNSKLLFLRL